MVFFCEGGLGGLYGLGGRVNINDKISVAMGLVCSSEELILNPGLLCCLARGLHCLL